jgi:hypothetical protein
MKTKGICPACRGALSLWTGLKAPTPFHLRCSHCKTKLRIEIKGFWLLLIFIVVLVVGLAIAWFAAVKKFGLLGFFAGFLFYAVACLVMEIVTGMIFYTYARLTPKITKGKI